MATRTTHTPTRYRRSAWIFGLGHPKRSQHGISMRKPRTCGELQRSADGKVSCEATDNKLPLPQKKHGKVNKLISAIIKYHLLVLIKLIYNDNSGTTMSKQAVVGHNMYHYYHYGVVLVTHWNPVVSATQWGPGSIFDQAGGFHQALGPSTMFGKPTAMNKQLSKTAVGNIQF